MKKPGTKKLNIPHLLFVVMLSLWGLIILYPFYNAVLISLVPQAVYTRTPFLIWPREITFESYQYVFGWKLIRWGIFSTVIITVVGTVYSMILTVITAYPLTKNIPGRKFFSLMIVFTMYFGGGLVPYYLHINNTLGLRNTRWAMILPLGISVFNMLVMQSYFRTLPAEIEESAKIDGANDIIILFRIVLPLSLPMLATITLFYAVGKWNEWWHGMLFIRKLERFPLQYHIRQMLMSVEAVKGAIPYEDQIQPFPMGIQMAAIIVTMFPIVCLYPSLQKYFVKGLTLDGYCPGKILRICQLGKGRTAAALPRS